MFVAVVFSLKFCFQLIHHQTPFTEHIYAVAAVKKQEFYIDL